MTPQSHTRDGVPVSRRRQHPVADRFDKPDRVRRVGVHRSPPRKGVVWMRVLWVVLATAVLTAIGIVFVVIGPDNLLFPEAADTTKEAETTEEIVQGVTDPETTVTVLNGTSIPGRGEQVEATITEGNLGTVTFVGDAADQNTAISAVFYHDPADEALAKGLGEKLGGVFYYLREDYARYETQLIVLIGSDFPGVDSGAEPIPQSDFEGGSGDTPGSGPAQ